MSGKAILKHTVSKKSKVKVSKYTQEYREGLIDTITDTIWQNAKDELKESEAVNDYYDVTEPGDLDENDYETKEEYKEAYDDCELWHDTIDELYENFTETANKLIKIRDWHGLLMLIREIAELPENIYTHETFTSLLFDCLPKPDNNDNDDNDDSDNDSDDGYNDNEED